MKCQLSGVVCNIATNGCVYKQYMKKLNYKIEPYPKGNNGMYELGTFIESIIIGAT